MEDEVKFESDVNSGFFWPWRSPNGSVIYTSLHKYTVKVVKIYRSLFYFSLIQILWLIENVISTKLQVLCMSMSRQIPNCCLENNWSFHLLSNLTCFWWANRPNMIQQNFIFQVSRRFVRMDVLSGRRFVKNRLRHFVRKTYCQDDFRCFVRTDLP